MQQDCSNPGSRREMTSPGKIQLERIITSLYSLPQTTHLSHLIIRIERARTDCVRDGLATPSPSEDGQAQNRLKRLLEELVEVLEEKRLAASDQTNDVGESRALHLDGGSAGEYTRVQGQVNTLLKRMRVQVYSTVSSPRAIVRSNIYTPDRVMTTLPVRVKSDLERLSRLYLPLLIPLYQRILHRRLKVSYLIPQLHSPLRLCYRLLFHRQSPNPSLKLILCTFLLLLL